MRVDVNNVGGGEASVSECFGDCSSGAATFWVGLRNMVPIRGQTGATVDTVDLRPACSGKLSRLKHHDACALTHDEAVAVNVVRARGGRRVVIAS